MLIHYTKSLESAKSIISSGELWLKYLGGTQDTEEVNHYMNEFNRHHYLVELNSILSNFLSYKGPGTPSTKDIIIQIAQNKIQWLEGISHGATFAEILRENAYLVCFTENNNSKFHGTEYGFYSFEFEGNPLLEEKIDTHHFIQEKVIYFNSKEIYNLQFSINKMESENELEVSSTNPKTIEDIEQDLDVLDSTLSSSAFLRKWKSDVTYHLNKFDQSMVKNVHSWSKKMKFYSGFNVQLNKTVKFINNLMIERRAEKKMLYLKKDIAFKKQLIKQVENEKGMQKATKLNLLSCFLKDRKFRNDDETRIVAIPKSSEGLSNGEWLKVPFDSVKLKKIKVSPDAPNKENDIKELKEALGKAGFQEVIVE